MSVGGGGATPSPQAKTHRVSHDERGRPAHGYRVHRVAGVSGFVWWVMALRYPTEHRDEVRQTLVLSGKPREWMVAGPFATKAQAEAVVSPRDLRQ